jgi:uncharacterized NAD(P)/FAD-binding protein YdhS
MRQTRYDVLIIGGGFSGTILACQLARCCSREFSIAILERNGRPGRGVAYGTQCSEHLLNVPAGNMSAFPDRPDHFVDWLGKSAPTLAHPTEFVPRRLFGQYVGEQLDHALEETSLKLSWIDEEAVAIHLGESQKVVVQLLSGSELTTKYAVLATGNFPPTDPLPLRQKISSSYVRCARSDDALRGLSDSSSILLLGSGLTAIDQVLALHATAFQGRIFMLSRRGLLPYTHDCRENWPTDWTRSLPRTARGLLAAVRREVRLAEYRGSDWRAVIDSLRSNSHKIWQALPLDEQKRFLRHVRPYWEVHRHRQAPRVQELLVHLQEANQLCLIAGRVLACRCGPTGAKVRCRMRTTGKEFTLRVDRIVNCTGHEADLRKLQNPLTQSLVSQDLARPNPLSLGLDVAEDGALIGGGGIPSQALFAIGPLRKGCLWETTAVPEIRVQAEALAELLATRLENRCASRQTREDGHSNRSPQTTDRTGLQ